jgi:hypothetical protein
VIAPVLLCDPSRPSRPINGIRWALSLLRPRRGGAFVAAGLHVTIDCRHMDSQRNTSTRGSHTQRTRKVHNCNHATAIPIAPNTQIVCQQRTHVWNHSRAPLVVRTDALVIAGLDSFGSLPIIMRSQLGVLVVGRRPEREMSKYAIYPLRHEVMMNNV